MNQGATNKNWHILFCDEQMDPCPVSEFFEGCRPRHQIKILRFLSLLEEQGPTLPRPYADLLVDGLHELRIKLSGDQIRLLAEADHCDPELTFRLCRYMGLPEPENCHRMKS